MATKSEQSLLKLILSSKEPMSADMNFFASYIAKFRPDGSFYFAQDTERQGLVELRFRYSFKTTTNRIIKAIVAIEIRGPLQYQKTKESSFSWSYRSLQLDDQSVFKTTDRKLSYISQHKVIQELKFRKGKSSDVSMDNAAILEDMIWQFERKAFEQLKAEGARRARQQRAKVDQETKKEQVLLALHDKLMNDNSLVGSESAGRLFKYLVTHCAQDTKLIKQMFNEMVHIIQP